jgi:RNA polymerase sigma factor (sigma-70 family)
MGVDVPPKLTSNEAVAAAVTDHPLRHYLEQNTPRLLGFIRATALKHGLGESAPIELAAQEVFSQTVVTALESAEKFDISRSPQAWLMGIAVKKLMKYHEQATSQNKRETTISRLNITPEDDEIANGLDLFDRLAALNPRVFDEIAQDNPETMIVNSAIAETEQAQLKRALARLSVTDRQVIRLGVEQGLDGNTLAQSLNVKPNTARVRLHRAIGKLQNLMMEEMGDEL